jgi:hypothetical protein
MMAGTLNAQGVYLRLGVGGGIGLKQYSGYDWSDYSRIDTNYSYKIYSMGLGSGFNINFAAGYMISQYVGFEFGINEFIGFTKSTDYSVSNSYHYTSEYYNYGYNYSDIMTNKISGMMLQIVPAVVITPGLEKVNPYARIGLILGVAPSVTIKSNGTYSYSSYSQPENYYYKDTSYTNTTVQKIKLSGGIAVGFTAAGGVDFNLGKNIDLYAELVYSGITYAPSKGKVTEWTENGIDQLILPTTTVKEKEWTFEKDIHYYDNLSDFSPAKLPKVSFNFSNVELNIGVKFKFGKK